MSSKVMPRRTVLIGGGRMLALPLLDAMIPARALSAVATPKRFFSFFQPTGTYDGSKLTGNLNEFWRPPGGLMTKAPIAMTPLAAHLEDILSITNLNNGGVTNANYADNGPYGHSRRASCFLTCSPVNKVDNYQTISISDSLDQVILQDMKSKNLVPAAMQSLFSCLINPQATSASESNTEYGNCISYAGNKALRPIYDPKTLLNKFFIGVPDAGAPTGSGTAASDEAKKTYNKSYLDFMSGGIQKLKSSVGTSDGRILDEWLDSIRALEVTADTLAQQNQSGGLSCQKPNNSPAGQACAANEQGMVGQFFLDYADFAIRASVLAMKCDLVRTGGLMFAPEPRGSNFSQILKGSLLEPGAEQVINANSHLGITHHQNNVNRIKALLSIQRMEMRIVNRMVELLKATQDVTGNMLDNTLLMYGGGFGDGDRHSENPPRILIGGKALGVKTGRWLEGKNNEVADVYVGILQAMGVNATQFGRKGGQSKRVFNLG